VSAPISSPHSSARLQRLSTLLALIALLALAWIAYRPGLSGDFLFDDFGNLPDIGATGPVNRADTLARYLTSGTADPTGRPLTLASFLIDTREWPAPPYPFKRTNVLIHLLNGLLLYLTLARLGREFKLAATPAHIAALFGAGAWLLHPLLVSTTLYVVQREAMLPATFTLLGLLGWMQARGALQRGQIRRGTLGMLLAIGGGTLLATLAKGNGALLPLLVLLVEWLVLAPAQPMPSPSARRRLKLRVVMLLALPSAVLLAWMISGIPGYIHGTPPLRGWTVGQRLLSEARALGDYLAMLVLLKDSTLGLFTDAFAPSTGWLTPWTTLPCVLLIAMLISLAFALRKRWPAFSLAVLFYFAGHLLESTWLPLELYYEHRNYLPSLLLFWPLGLVLAPPGALIWLRRGVGAALLLTLTALTYQRARVWGDGYQQAQIWAAFNPSSARAQASAAQYQMGHGMPRLAAARLTIAMAAHPDDLQIPVNLIGAQCRFGPVSPAALDGLRRALSNARNGGTLGFDWLNTAIDMAASHRCAGLDLDTVQSFIDAGRHNPRWSVIPGRRQDLLHLQGMLELAKGRPDAALQAFDRALAEEPGPATALEQAATLGAHGAPRQGLAHLDYWQRLQAPSQASRGMPKLHAWVLARQHYWENEISHLRATLAADVAAQTRQPLPPSRD
jgi:hypothetical protein